MEIYKFRWLRVLENNVLQYILNVILFFFKLWKMYYIAVPFVELKFKVWECCFIEGNWGNVWKKVYKKCITIGLYYQIVIMKIEYLYYLFKHAHKYLYSYLYWSLTLTQIIWALVTTGINLILSWLFCYLLIFLMFFMVSVTTAISKVKFAICDDLLSQSEISTKMN